MIDTLRARPSIRRVLFAVTALCLLPTPTFSRESLPNAKPIPNLQIIPLPYDQASFQRDGVEITRFHFGSTLHRPFLYPVIGPSGISLTRMGHPHDPHGHRHHNSVWISHLDINGVNFWADTGDGRIVCRYIEKYADGPEQAYLVARNDWVDGGGKAVLNEARRVTVHLLPEKEWLLTIDLDFSAPDGDVTIGQNPFGMIGVRMAKTVGVHDGGGTIRNSEGAVDEEEVFRKPARWVDYSGLTVSDTAEGITLFDHPSNPNHPAPFHVRNDGWMGACLTLDAPITVSPQNPLRLRYGLYVHSGVPAPAAIEAHWQSFADSTAPVREK